MPPDATLPQLLPADPRPGRQRPVLLPWLPILAWAGVIFLFSTGTFGSSHTAPVLAWVLDRLGLVLAPQHFEVLHALLRKLAHLTEYALLAVLLYRLLRLGRSGRGGALVAAVALAGLFSITDEYHQSFVPGRDASPRDCAIDTTGAALGVSGCALASGLRRRRRLARP